jgi:hypothetical protein
VPKGLSVVKKPVNQVPFLKKGRMKVIDQQKGAFPLPSGKSPLIIVN